METTKKRNPKSKRKVKPLSDKTVQVHHDPAYFVCMNNGVAATIMNDKYHTIIADPDVMTNKQWMDIFDTHLHMESSIVPIVLMIHDPCKDESPLKTLVFTLQMLTLSGKSFNLSIKIMNYTSFSAMRWIEIVRYEYLTKLAFYVTLENFKALWDLESHDSKQDMYDTYSSSIRIAHEEFETCKEQLNVCLNICSQHKKC